MDTTPPTNSPSNWPTNPVIKPNPASNTLVILLVVLVLLLMGGLGYVVFQNYKLQNKITSMSYSPSPTPNSSPSPTSKIQDWKTYTDSSNHFSLMYPGDWNTGTVYGFSILTPESNNRLGMQIQEIAIQVLPNPNHLTSRQYVDQKVIPGQKGSPCTNFKYNQQMPDALKNLDATIVEGLCGVLDQGPQTYIVQSNNIISIFSSFSDPINTPTKIDRNLVYQILSTFKFTNSSPVPTASCKPRPACLDSTPRCLIAETSDMCPASPQP